ncbi:hypothetical protein DFH09DRAFT_1083530 [Mycena vulgaris]|nr:hypothetical protein DFH09DRAFT_1083530 [Mycena vulgaris]
MYETAGQFYQQTSTENPFPPNPPASASTVYPKRNAPRPHTPRYPPQVQARDISPQAQPGETCSPMLAATTSPPIIPRRRHTKTPRDGREDDRKGVTEGREADKQKSRKKKRSEGGSSAADAAHRDIHSKQRSAYTRRRIRHRRRQAREHARSAVRPPTRMPRTPPKARPCRPQNDANASARARTHLKRPQAQAEKMETRKTETGGKKAGGREEEGRKESEERDEKECGKVDQSRSTLHQHQGPSSIEVHGGVHSHIHPTMLKVIAATARRIAPTPVHPSAGGTAPRALHIEAAHVTQSAHVADRTHLHRPSAR